MTDPVTPGLKLLLGFTLGVLALLVLLFVTAPVPLSPHSYLIKEAVHG